MIKHSRWTVPATTRHRCLMVDPRKLPSETPSTVSDREVMAATRLNARVKAFAGRSLDDDVIEQINAAVVDEMDRLVQEGVLRERPGWLAALVGGKLHVAFGTSAVQRLSQDLKCSGSI